MKALMRQTEDVLVQIMPHGCGDYYLLMEFIAGRIQHILSLYFRKSIYNNSQKISSVFVLLK